MNIYKMNNIIFTYIKKKIFYNFKGKWTETLE